MTRYIVPPFQFDRPLFVKVPLFERGVSYKAGDQFKWREMRIDPMRIQRMYAQGQFYHSEELEETLAPQIGDGLNELNIESLHKIVDKINAKVKLLANDKIAVCRKSNIKDKQAGHIRSWRLHHGEHE